MIFASMLCGGAPVKLQYQVGENMATAGVPVVKGGSGAKGITLATTIAAVGMLGCTLDTATLVTAQQTDNSDTARFVTVIVNPLAVWRAKLSGGAGNNTALTKYNVTTAASDGLSVTSTAIDWTSPASDEGLLYGYDGANAGIGRKITSTGAATVATLLVALPNDTVVGDNFLRIPLVASPYGYETEYPQLTTTLDQVDASAAVDTDNVNLRAVKLELRDKAGEGVTNSYVHLISHGHLFSAGLPV